MGWPLVLLQVGIIAGSYAYQRWIKDHEQDDPKRDAFRLPRSRENAPIALIYGTARVNEPHLIGVFAYGANPILEGSVPVGYEYTAAMDFGIGIPMGATGAALVPYSELRSIWVNDRRQIQALPFGSGAGGAGTGNFVDEERNVRFAYHPGTFDQPQDPGLVQNFINANPDLDEDLLPSYPGLAHLVFRNNGTGSLPHTSHWGTSGSFPSIAAEIFAVTAPLGRGAIVDAAAPTTHPVTGNLLDYAPGHDANPAEVVFDLLCNTFGRAGIDESKIDTTSFEAAADVLETEGIGFSGVLTDARELVSYLQEIMAQVGGVLYEDFSDGLIKMKLFRASDTSVATFGPSDIDRIQWKAATWANTYNTVHLTYTSRAREYQDATITGQDDAHIEEFGIREQAVRYPYCCTEAQAKRLLARELKILSIPVGSGTITMNRAATDVSPGDVITVNYPEHNLSNVEVRVLRVRHGTLADARIQLDVVEDIFAVDYDVSDGGWQNPPLAPTVSQVTDALVVESPRWMNLWETAYLTNPEAPRLLYLAKRPSTGFADSCDAYASADSGASYQLDRQNCKFTPQAKLLNSYARTKSPYDTDVAGMSIYDLDTSGALRNESSAVELHLKGANLILVAQMASDGILEHAEFMQYESFTDLGGGVYRLNDITRGNADTSPRDFAADSIVWILDPATRGLNIIGRTERATLATYLARMVPRSLWGSGTVDQADDYEFTTGNRATRPLPVDDLEIDDE